MSTAYWKCVLKANWENTRLVGRLFEPDLQFVFSLAWNRSGDHAAGTYQLHRSTYCMSVHHTRRVRTHPGFLQRRTLIASSDRSSHRVTDSAHVTFFDAERKKIKQSELQLVTLGLRQVIATEITIHAFFRCGTTIVSCSPHLTLLNGFWVRF